MDKQLWFMLLQKEGRLEQVYQHETIIILAVFSLFKYLRGADVTSAFQGLLQDIPLGKCISLPFTGRKTVFLICQFSINKG